MSKPAQRKRRATVRNPLLIARERGVWHADLVGQITGYAKTEEGYVRRQEAARKQARSINEKGQRGSRKGVPDGYGRRRAELAALREEAGRLAHEVVTVLLEPASTPGAAERLAIVRAVFVAACDKTLSGPERTATLAGLGASMRAEQEPQELVLVSAEGWFTKTERGASAPD